MKAQFRATINISGLGFDIDESCPIPQFDLYKCVTCGKVLSGDDLSQEDHQQQCLGV